jgi:choline-sulfatase
MTPGNLIVILSDEHARGALGCYGNPVVQTPHLDRLAAEGTTFTHAYTPCPICVPARASLATGRYVHEIGAWDNAFPYDGSVRSWAHVVRDAGLTVDSIGKLHFRSSDDDNGFSREIDPLHVVDGVGDLLGAVRDDPPPRRKRPGVLEAGPGDSGYLRYDVSNADRACRWLAEHAHEARPWVLFVSFVCPHPPYLAPPEHYERYASSPLPMPPQWRAEEWPRHPAIDRFRRFFDFAEPFDEETIRRLVAAYYGVCTHLDEQVGRVLRARSDAGLEETTRVVYTSDHGECLGARGIFGKFTMYDESAAVPLIVSGPDVPAGRTVGTPASLVDLFPTVLEAVGVGIDDEQRGLPGRSLWAAAREEERERTVFSEYHAVGARDGIFMVRDRRHKYVHYVHDPPQLFDLERDPEERHDLADAREHRGALLALEAALRAVLDPEATDARAKADQRAKVEAFGGRDAVIARGTFDNSPVPGEEPSFG